MQGPPETAVTAWARLNRAQRAVMAAIENELKAAGLPPLSWYDVLLELRRAKDGRLSPRELEREMLLEQYNLSRLLDRMEADGLVRRVPYPGDKRRQLVEISMAGRDLQKRMWQVYGAAIQRYIAAKLGDEEAESLAVLLQKLIMDVETQRA